jgi:hypothetical protein
MTDSQLVTQDPPVPLEVADAVNLRPTVSWSVRILLSPLKWQLQLIYDRQSVSQSVLVSGAHLGPMTNFSFSLTFLLDSCGFVIL